MKIIPIFLFFLIISCTHNNPKTGKQILDFGSFTLETPKSWKKIKAQGLDSYVGQIAIDDADTLHFDLGWYSNTLTERDPKFIERSLFQDFGNLIDTTGLIVVENYKDIDPDKYKINNVSWDTIDGRKVKIVFPKKSGFGTTGIYIDSLWQAGSGIDRFNLYGTNLKQVNEKLVLQSLKTLKFHKTE